MCKKLISLVSFVFVLGVVVSLCPAAIVPVTSVTVDNPDGTIPYNLLSITVDGYTVNVERLVVGTTTVGLTGNGQPWSEMDNLDIHDAIDTGLGTSATTMLFGEKNWINTNGDNPDFFMFESHGGNSSADNPQVAAILSGGVIGQAVTLNGGNFGPTEYFRVDNAPDGMGMAGQQILGISFDITDLLDVGGNPLTNSSVIEGIALTVRGGADITCLCAISAGKVLIAHNPTPSDGELIMDTWVSLSWSPGDFAASHDVYLSENFDDVNTGAESAFHGNHALTFIIAGFPGNAYPDGLVPGTTYYWRVDEVNETEPNSPWKGDTWSFSIPPNTAYNPIPADGAEFVGLNTQLNWTEGLGAKVHNIVFGEDFDEVNNAPTGVPNGTTSYNPGQLKLAKTYYWRVDEFDGITTHKGEVWSFTTEGAVSGPNPADSAVDVNPAQILSWNAGAVAASHEVYFGTDADAVANATTTSPEYKGPKILGEESYDPGKLILNTTYYWRIDEVNDISPDSPWAGNVWSFSTGGFFVIDDFEDYDVGNNEIWWAWKDGLGYVAYDNKPAFPGNGTGAAVGDETTASYTEETIVHGGSQSMPFFYDNNKQGYANYSETELTLTAQRDWTAEGVAELSIWFRGNPGSTGSFVESPVGTYTMTGSGADIWNNGPGAGEYHDEFHFAYKMLTGAGSIIAKVESVEQTDNWAKAGVMIRETLDGGSKHAFVCVTPANGVASQGRPDTGAASFNTAQGGITAPYWVKLERSISGLFTVSHSADGSNWQQVTGATPENISMSTNVYIGLAVTSHNTALTCQAVFSNVSTTGNVSGQWANQDIGIASNDAEPLYVAVSNSTGTPAVVIHDDPAAAQIDTWTEWIIPLQAFADQGIVLNNVDKIGVGLGTQGNMTIPGGSGKLFLDNIRLYQPRPESQTQP